METIRKRKGFSGADKKNRGKESKEVKNMKQEHPPHRAVVDLNGLTPKILTRILGFETQEEPLEYLRKSIPEQSGRSIEEETMK